MISRERLLLSLSHKEPDRVPIDLGATPSSNISAIAYNRLKKELGLLKNGTRVYDVCQQVVLPENEILDRFGVDVIDIAQAWNTDDENWNETVLSDGSRALYPAWFDFRKQPDGSMTAHLKDGTAAGMMPQGATYFDQLIFPYMDGYPADYCSLEKDMVKVTWSAFAHAPWDSAAEPGFWEQLREKAIYLRENTDKALMLVCGCNLFEWGTFLRRMDNFLMDLLCEQGEVEKLLDALMAVHMKTLEKACRYVGDVVDIIRFGDDLGLDTGPFMKPDIYRKIFKKRHAKLCSYVKKHSSMKILFHSCGSLYKLLPDLIEAGFDIINPVQTSAADMEPKRLKKEFGSDIVFWGGGADTRKVLNRGTVQEVVEDVKRRLDIFMPGGGYVFNTVHNIMPDCPPENIIAMFEAVQKYGVY